jgi:hypothetical protein
MANLDSASYVVKYNDSGAGLFKDNTNKEIIPSRARDLVQDTSDSYLNKTDNFIDEDSFASDSATKVPSQQSTKAFILAQILANTNSINWKTSVKAATTANITLSGAQTIDGISCIATDRVLVKNQSTASQNGIYVVAAGAWTRATDMDVTSEFQNAVVSVDQGTTNADTSWRQTTDNVTVGSSSVVWAAFLSSVVYSATAAGTNTYTATLSPAITSYSTFQSYLIRFTNANSGASTLNLNALGAKTIVKNGSTALASADISAGQIYMIVYDGTNMQILGKITSSTGIGGSTGSTNEGVLVADGTGGSTVKASPVLINGDGDVTIGSTGSATPATITVQSASTNANLELQPKGTGRVAMFSSATIQRIDSNTNSDVSMLNINRQTSGTPATGIGARIDFDIETGVGNTENAANIIVSMTDVSSGSEDSKMEFQTQDAGGSATTKLLLNGNGLTVTGKFYLSALNTAPANASDTGTTGEIRIDANHIYICTASNTWKRVAIATW